MDLTRRTLFVLGFLKTVESIFPTSLFAQQQEGFPLRHGRLSEEEAEGILKRSLAIIQESYNTHDPAKILKIRETLKQLKKDCDYRDLHYKANILLATIEFGFDKTSFSPTYQYLEENIFQYELQEEKFGATAAYLEEILIALKKPNNLSMGIIGLSRICELHTRSKSKIKRGKLSELWKKVLTRSPSMIENKTLANALRALFSDDTIETYPEHYTDVQYDHQQDLRLENGGTARTYFGLEIGKPLIIKSDTGGAKPFPTLIFSPENVRRIFTDADKLVGVDIEPYLKMRRRGETKEILRDLENFGITCVGEDDIDRYKEDYLGKYWGRPMVKPARELKVKGGVTIEDFLKAGGGNPFSWIYG